MSLTKEIKHRRTFGFIGFPMQVKDLEKNFYSLGELLMKLKP
ncbi:hypothetical protein [Aequorivita sp. KMM 9714]|nr:hypothetical protein [Aequorivita sp. KMM 9714]